MNRSVVLGTIGAVILIFLIWWFLLWGPRNRSYNDANAAGQQADSQVQQLRAEVSRLKSIRQQIPELQAEMARLQAAVPDKPELDQIILRLNSAAVDAGVDLLSISPTQPTATSATHTAGAAGGPPAIKIALSLKGGYEELLDFINRIDSPPRLLVIDTLGLSSNATTPGASPTGGPAGGGSAAELNISMSVRVFVTTAPPAVGSTTTKTTIPSGTSGITTTTAPGATTATTAPTTSTTG